VTGIFGNRYFLKYFVAADLHALNFCGEILRDSNTLDIIPEHRCRSGDAGCVFSYRHKRKTNCGRTSLVYLENALGNSSRALRNKVSFVMLIGG